MTGGACSPRRQPVSGREPNSRPEPSRSTTHCPQPWRIPIGLIRTFRATFATSLKNEHRAFWGRPWSFHFHSCRPLRPLRPVCRSNLGSVAERSRRPPWKGSNSVRSNTRFLARGDEGIFLNGGWTVVYCGYKAWGLAEGVEIHSSSPSSFELTFGCPRHEYHGVPSSTVLIWGSGVLVRITFEDGRPPRPSCRSVRIRLVSRRQRRQVGRWLGRKLCPVRGADVDSSKGRVETFAILLQLNILPKTA